MNIQSYTINHETQNFLVSVRKRTNYINFFSLILLWRMCSAIKYKIKTWVLSMNIHINPGKDQVNWKWIMQEEKEKLV